MKVKPFLLLGVLFFFCSEFVFAQVDTTTQFNQTVIKNFRISPGGSLEFTTPQKYGLNVRFTLGVKKTNRVSTNGYYRDSSELRGLNFEGGLFRGGYRLGLYFINIGYSMVGPAGGKIGFVYLNNNSFSSVSKSSEMIGLEIAVQAMYQLRLGILKEVNSKKVIPSLGFGFAIGPFF